MSIEIERDIKLPPLRLRDGHQLMNEAKLLHDRRRQDKRIQIGLSHAAVDAVERESQRQPRIDQLLNALRTIRLEIDLRFQFGADVEAGMDADPERASHFQR